MELYPHFACRSYCKSNPVDCFNRLMTVLLEYIICFDDISTFQIFNISQLAAGCAISTYNCFYYAKNNFTKACGPADL